MNRAGGVYRHCRDFDRRNPTISDRLSQDGPTGRVYENLMETRGGTVFPESGRRAWIRKLEQALAAADEIARELGTSPLSARAAAEIQVQIEAVRAALALYRESQGWKVDPEWSDILSRLLAEGLPHIPTGSSPPPPKSVK